MRLFKRIAKMTNLTDSRDSLEKYLKGQSKKDKAILLAVAVGLMLFILTASVGPFRSQLFNALFPKPPSNAAPITPPLTAPLATGRIDWQGQRWYLHGVNVPWYQWGCDFGCNASGGVLGNSAAISAGFQKLKDSGIHFVRWWAFEGNPWQIQKDASGAPTGLDPKVYADFDEALRLANQYDLYFDFVLFSSPTAIPVSWETDPTQRQKLADALAPLFAKYKDNPRILSWELYNEPEFDIWNNKIAQAPVIDTATLLTQTIHQNAPSVLVTVGNAFADGMPMWQNVGLDYYSPHWYDYMNSGTYCIRCNDYNFYATKFNINKPIVVGEFYAGADADALARFNDFYNRGYAGAWAWSLFPDKTSDKMAVDFNSALYFAASVPDAGPRTMARPPLPSAIPTPIPKPSFTFGATLSADPIDAGKTLTVTLTSKSATQTTALIDAEIYDPTGKKVFSQAFDNQSYGAGETKTYALNWAIPPDAFAGNYVLKLGAFSTGWGTLYSWVDSAATFTVNSATQIPHYSSYATTSGGASPGSPTQISASVTVTANITALVDVEVYSPTAQVFQKAFDNQAFTANQPENFSVIWPIPPDAAAGTYTIKIGVFSPGWGTLYDWNGTAGGFTVGPAAGGPTASASPPTPTRPPTPTPPPVPCAITSATWAAASVVEKQSVQLDVKTQGDCGGKQVNFEVRRNLNLMPDQLAVNQPAPNPVTISGGAASEIWTADNWVDNCPLTSVLTGACDPEYFFKTNIVGDSKMVESSPRLIKITKSTESTITPTASLTIYNDSLQGWGDCSWGTEAGFNAANFVHSGAWSISDKSSDWGALSICVNNFGSIDMTPYTHLQFWVNGGNNAAQYYGLLLYTENTTIRVDLDRYLTGGITKGTWKEVNVPLADLGLGPSLGGNLTHKAYRIAFQKYPGGDATPTLFIDDIKFINDGVTKAPAAPTAQDSWLQGWSDCSWSAAFNYGDTAFVRSGIYSTSAKIQDWGALSMCLPQDSGFDVSQDTHLELWVNGGLSPNQHYQLLFYTESATVTVNLDRYVDGGSVAANTWRKVSIPLADLGIGPKLGGGYTHQAFRMAIQKLPGGDPSPTLYIDDVVFVNDGVTKLPPPPAPDDGWLKGWVDCSKDAGVSYGATGFVRSGLYSASFTPQAGGTLGFCQSSSGSGFDPSPYNRLSFYINGGATSGQKYTISVNDYPAVSLDDYMPGGQVLAGKWVKVDIPFKDLGIDGYNLISGIYIKSATAQPTGYIDDVLFYNDGSGPLPLKGLSFTVNTGETVGSFSHQMLGMAMVNWEHSWGKPFVNEVPGLAQAMKAAGVGLIRYAGGNWVNSVGFDRVPQRRPFTAWQKNGQTYYFQYGTDELDSLHKLANSIGADVMIQVNTSTFDPATWADMVRYTNIEKGYNFKYWELGNEPDLAGNITPQEYARRVKEYTDAMKVVDPTIKIIAGVPASAHDAPRLGWSDSVTDLSAFLSQSAQAESPGGRKVDGLSYHWYQQNNDTKLDDLTRWDWSGLDHKSWRNSYARIWSDIIPRRVKDEIIDTTNPKLTQGITELNYDATSYDNPLNGNHMNALWASDILGRLAYRGLDFNTWYEGYGAQAYAMLYPDNSDRPTKIFARPSFLAYLMYAKYFGDRMVKSTPDSSTNLVSVWASTDSKNPGKLNLRITNLAGKAYKGSFNLEGFNASGGLAYTLQSSSPLDISAASDTANAPTTINGVKIDAMDVEGSLTAVKPQSVAASGSTLSYTIPAYSSVAIVLTSSQPAPAQPPPPPTNPPPTESGGGSSGGGSGGGGGGSTGNGGSSGGSSAPSPASGGKPGDLDKNGRVDIFDLSRMLRVWNRADSDSDLNHDGVVNIFDFSILLRNWTR